MNKKVFGSLCLLVAVFWAGVMGWVLYGCHNRLFPPLEGTITANYYGAPAVIRKVSADSYEVSVKKQDGSWSPVFHSNETDLVLFRY